jgi:hypothetical protein
MFDLTSLRKAHTRFMWANHRMVKRVLNRAAPEAQKHVRDKAGFTHRTGTALARTTARVMRLKSGGKIRIANAARHAKWLEHGTRAHVIRARRARYLRFFWRKLGRVVYFKSVRHPGTRPYRFLYLATHAVGDRVRLGIKGGMRRAAKRF